jgi:type IV pilus assembly protein PilM
MFFSSKKVIGLDLGSSSIKMAELKLSGKTAELENFASVQTPLQAVTNGEISDSFLLGEAIKSLYSEQRFSRKNANVGMWGNSAIVKKISLPKRDPKELQDQIKFEAQQYLPFDISQVTLEHHILPFSSAPDMMDVLIIAAQNDFIGKYVEVTTFAGLKCKIIDVSSLALANIFEFNYGRFNEPIALFNFGASSTQFLVVLQGEVLFVRDIPVGGFHFTNEISKNMGITLEEAEALKLSQASAADVPENTRTFMNMALDYVTEEIRNSIDFYSASGGDAQITKAYFTGGASLTEGMTEHLQDVLKIPFEQLNPLIRIKPANKKLTPEFLSQVNPFLATTLGLALREVGDS